MEPSITTEKPQRSYRMTPAALEQRKKAAQISKDRRALIKSQAEQFKRIMDERSKTAPTPDTKMAGTETDNQQPPNSDIKEEMTPTQEDTTMSTPSGSGEKSDTVIVDGTALDDSKSAMPTQAEIQRAEEEKKARAFPPAIQNAIAHAQISHYPPHSSTPGSYHHAIHGNINPWAGVAQAPTQQPPSFFRTEERIQNLGSTRKRNRNDSEAQRQPLNNTGLSAASAAAGFQLDASLSRAFPTSNYGFNSNTFLKF